MQCDWLISRLLLWNGNLKSKQQTVFIEKASTLNLS